GASQPDDAGARTVAGGACPGGCGQAGERCMSARLLGRPTGTSPIVSARPPSFPRAGSPNEARGEPRRRVIPELLLDRTAFWGRQPPASLDKTDIAPERFG